jgi:hypothetical protein
VEHFERVSARHCALFYERFLRREQGRVELALRRSECAVCGKRPCCIYMRDMGWKCREKRNEIGLMDAECLPFECGILLTDVGGVAAGNFFEKSRVIDGVSKSHGKMRMDDAHALVFPACIYEDQLSVTEDVVISGIMYDQRVFPALREIPS